MISSNVSVSVINPEDEPLSGWLLSLDRLAELPDDVLVFPSHGVPFRGVKRRVAELHAHHTRRFQVILDACADRSCSAYELAQRVYPPPLPDFDQLLALGECLAHIRYLTADGRLDGVPDDNGVLRYRVSPR
jgi:glyoxylase-like metal-dependent hydrolase (beta-lactamase superfamily II)